MWVSVAGVCRVIVHMPVCVCVSACGYICVCGWVVPGVCVACVVVYLVLWVCGAWCLCWVLAASGIRCCIWIFLMDLHVISGAKVPS